MARTAPSASIWLLTLAAGCASRERGAPPLPPCCPEPRHEWRAATPYDTEAIAQEARGADLPGVAMAIERIYEGGDRDAAADLAVSAGILPFDAADATARVRAVYWSRIDGGAVELTVERRDQNRQPLAVAFPPGTFARVDASTDRHLDVRTFASRPQELALLRGRVIHVPPAKRSASVTVPVACCDVYLSPPRNGQVLELARFARGSARDRVAVLACKGDRPRAPEVQVALWSLDPTLRWQDLEVACREATTFGGERIERRHLEALRGTLLDAGVDMDEVRISGP